MDFIWLILISLFSGVFAGMGMGGGTFLIPLLTILMAIPQNIAQGVNLIVFIPMAIIVCIIYIKNHLIDYKNAWIIALPALALCVLGALIAVQIKGNVLKIIFGSFVFAVGVFELIMFLYKKCKKKVNA